MDIFDKVDPETLDRRRWHLSMLSLAIIVILAVGEVLLMYPSVFSSNSGSTTHTTRILFCGFCALCVLLVAYLFNRESVVHQLRRNLQRQHTEMMNLRQEASADLLKTLPGFSDFQDRLTMGFRRAAQSGEALSLILVRLKPSPTFNRPPEISVMLGDASRALVRKLRPDDSLYCVSACAFAMLLPNTGGAETVQVASRVAEGLADASGVSNRFAFDVQVVNYPEQASTAYEMEHIAKTFSNAA